MIEEFQDTIMEPGDVATLLCKTFGGNPLPSLQWYRNGVSLNHQYVTMEETKTVTSELIVHVNASDNNAIYRCEAKNAALDRPRNTSVRFRVQCK